MPVEIEYKYVLNDIEDELNLNCMEIKQIYLEKGIRFREIKENNNFRYEFNFKTKIDVGNLEIHEDINKSDFDLALTKARVILHKRRYELKTKNHIWEIDFFIDELKTYFCMMECEVDEGVIPDISELPDFIRNNIIKEVALDDQRYTSHNIANPDYAKYLLNNTLKAL